MRLPSLFGTPILIAVCASVFAIGFAMPSYAQHGGGGHGGGGGGHAGGGGGFSGHAGGGAPSGSSGGFHSNSGGGFSGRPASGFRPGFSSGSNSGMVGRPAYSYPRNSIPPSQRFSSYRSANAYSSAARINGNNRGGYRTDQSRPAYSGNRRGYGGGNRRGRREQFGYGYGGYPWLGVPYLGYFGSDFDYPDDYYDNGDNSNAPADNGANNYVTEDYPGSDANQPQGYDLNQGYDPNQDDPNQGPGYADRPAEPYGYQPAPQDYRPGRAATPPPNQPTVTLVFRDGHQQQIHNYILSRETLSVLDARHQEIPVDQIDLAATEKVNKQAGVSFHLPSR